jgi:hypothetical protein
MLRLAVLCLIVLSESWELLFCVEKLSFGSVVLEESVLCGAWWYSLDELIFRLVIFLTL